MHLDGVHEAATKGTQHLFRRHMSCCSTHHLICIRLFPHLRRDLARSPLETAASLTATDLAGASADAPAASSHGNTQHRYTTQSADSQEYDTSHAKLALQILLLRTQTVANGTDAQTGNSFAVERVDTLLSSPSQHPLSLSQYLRERAEAQRTW